MPQMAPMNWTLLFVYFIFLFLFISVINSYLFKYIPKIKNFIKNLNFSNWKW
uniref:ATP synthase complex subunit 8 n=1 Tax=Curculionidae sp. 4 AH-2016 TaxID=1903830 RepID=A0A343C2Q9_9CUCU|nr:ATP synthase F0 subunit 8 [Curculionidae sp. 4 AH-2016]